MILLDTNAFLWMVSGESLLGPKSTEAIERASQEGAIRISAITPWEISMLAEKGKINLEMDTLAWFHTALDQAKVDLEPISLLIAVEAGRLPRAIHGNPADRIIIATARSLDWPLLTTDRKILAHAKQGFLEAIDARR